MIVSSVRLQNYRRLNNTELVLGDQKTVLVGANNSGKTSCIAALHTFLVAPKTLQLRDIAKHHWKAIIALGEELAAKEPTEEEFKDATSKLINLLPSLDIRIDAEVSEAFKAREILPDLSWNGGLLACRIRYEPKNPTELLDAYKKSREVVSAHSDVSMWPKNLFDFLEKGQNFSNFFVQKHYILGADDAAGGEPRLQPISVEVLKTLIRVDVISEQRGLGTEDGGSKRAAFSEKQQLSKLLRNYYDSFLNPEDFPEEGDIEALKLRQNVEEDFTKQLGKQFKNPLKELADMGYPGVGGNPSVEIAAKISGTDALQKSSSVQYRFDKSDEDTLPESYLGLGYQNLIYLTFRLLEFRDRWMRVGKSTSTDSQLTEEIEPVHLVLVEEPEVNLHAQVQRVFVAKAYEKLRNHAKLGDLPQYRTQLVVSTHSSHVVNDVDFKDLRYFRRCASDKSVTMDHTVVENMSDLFVKPKEELRFVRKHLKLTHCDIFFADGVIFVEGQAERLLVPEFIARNHPDLTSRYVSILEVSGAHTHKYRELVERLGVRTLVITDLDSVDDDGKCATKRGANQESNNDTLKSWHPAKAKIDELLDLSPQDYATISAGAPLYVAYQLPITVNGKEVLCRTFEDALIASNLGNEFFTKKKTIEDANDEFESGKGDLATSLFEYVQTLTKGDFAFNCLVHLTEKDENTFNEPDYISEGLKWLEVQLKPGK
ncbi:MAG: AAA family ATPase [Rubripirellula sp.]